MEMNIKEIFREGWNHEGRVQNWVSVIVQMGFDNPTCRSAWREVLRNATATIIRGEVLDIGAGPGTITELWAEMGHNVYGLDFSQTMLDLARKRSVQRELTITYVEGDAENPPFKPERFDIISSRLLLFTLPHPGYAVRRWVQLLKPGGWLVLIGEELSADAEKKQHPKNSLWSPDKRYRAALRQLPLLTHSADTLRVLMEAVGLSGIQSVPMEMVVAARAELSERESSHEMCQSRPYILVGRK